MEASPRRLVLVEQISTQQDEIYLQANKYTNQRVFKTHDPQCCAFTHLSTCMYLVCLGIFKDLVQCVVRVIATDGILLKVAEVNVCSDEDLEGVLIIPKTKGSAK